MHQQLPDFTNASVLVTGDVMLDRYWFGETARISPEAPVPVVKIRQTNERPGGAGNVALNIASLGAKVTLLGVTGNDEPAHQIKEQLQAANVHSAILHFPTLQTITKLRIISRQQQLIRLDFEEKKLDFHSDLLIEVFQKHLKLANLVILSDYGKGTLDCVQELIHLANKANVCILVDPKGSDFSIYRGADIITPNLKEFEAIVGSTENNADITAKAKHFLEQMDVSAILLTRGEHGMTLVQENNEMHLPAHAREVFDVTGAGDTVIATLGAAIAAGDTLQNAMILANLAASLVVAKLGAVSVSATELAAALSHTNQRIDSGIMTEELLLGAVSKARMNGKKIVFTNGCFDILHAGHVAYLQQAKLLGDYLIVAINDDLSVKKIKGQNRPINNTQLRMAVLAALSAVDWVISFSDTTPERLLKLLQPDILVKGGDYQIDQVVGANIVYTYGGDVRVLGVIKDISTSLIIERMIDSEVS